MKNITDKTKKRLVVGGCLAACVVLVVLIGSRFATKPQTDDPLPSQSPQQSDVTVDTDAEKEKEAAVTVPDVSESAVTSSSTPTDSSADDSGTEQTIQGDATKPEYTDKQLTDPSEKPNGESATKSTPSTGSTNTTQSGGTSSSSSGSSSGGLPGFDNVPNLGENQVTEGHSTGDINKQVGEMD